MGLYDSEREEELIADQIERGISQDQAEREWSDNRKKIQKEEAFDPMSLMSIGDEKNRLSVERIDLPTIFKDDYAYAEAALQLIKKETDQDLQVDFDADIKRIDLTAPESLYDRLNDIPNEALRNGKRLHLIANPSKIKNEIKLCRAEEEAWPQLHYLWRLNPVLEWMGDKIVSGFRRNEAPVISLSNGVLIPGETIYLMYGVVPNRNGQPLVHPWFGVQYIGNRFKSILDFETLCTRIDFKNKPIPNDARYLDLAGLKSNLSDAVKRAEIYALSKRDEIDKSINIKLNENLKRLEELKGRHKAFQLSLFDDDNLSENMKNKKKQKELEVDKFFNDFYNWIENSMTLEKHAYIKVVSVFEGIAK
jgi:hypothetical protein